tara:strand:- start:1091 stop:1342 length:252 start_codon:yes stop_codon:yes gene_type:complete
MNLQEFETKHHERFTPSTRDVLMRVASNLSDLHIEKDFFTPQQMDDKLNSLKEYIFDYRKVLELDYQNKAQGIAHKNTPPLHI